MLENKEVRIGRFQQMILNILKQYAVTASAEKLRDKYPDLPRDVIANKYITRVSRATLVAGAISGAVISIAELPAIASVVGTLLSAFTASPITVPALVISLPVVVAAFVAEMNYTLRLQVRMAYDLFLLYDLPLNPDDPEALWEAFLISLGAREVSGRALRVTMPKIATQQAQGRFRSGLMRRRVQNWAEKRLSRMFARRYLAEGFLLKMVVPGLNILLGAAWNYFATQGLGKFIIWQVRSRVMACDLIDKIELSRTVPAELLLDVACSVASNWFGANKREALNRLVERLKTINPTFEPTGMDRVWGDWTDIYPKLAMIQDHDSRKTINNVMQAMAIVDGRVGRRELKYLESVAQLYDFSFDKEAVELRSKHFVQPRPGRSCLVAATIIIGLLLVLVILACLAGSIVAISIVRGSTLG